MPWVDALYNGLYSAGRVLAYPYLRWVRGRGEEYFRGRSNPPRLPMEEGRVWIHAVSLGETNVGLILARALRSLDPGRPVVFSSATPTGMENLSRRWDGVSFYAPWDSARVVRTFLDAVRPEVLVVLETELWPNLIRLSKERGVRVLVVNARISDRAWGRYRWIRGFVKDRVLRFVDAVLCQDEVAKERFLGLGADPARVKVVGNIKYDLEIPKKDLGWVEEVVKGRFVLMGGSTHPGEEAFLLEAFASLREGDKDGFLILAPRHVERAREVAEEARRQGWRVAMYSQGSSGDGDVLVVDKVGVLAQLYRLASAVFVGGSLVPRGGQNPLEPAYWGKAVFFGPNMDNFRQISGELLEKGGAKVVRSARGLVREIVEGALEEMGRRAKGVVDSHRGVARRVAEEVLGV